MNTLHSSNQAFASFPNRQSLHKFLLFQVGKLDFALPVERVQKIMNNTPIFGSGKSSIGVAHIDDQEITVIELHQHFFKTTQDTAEQKGYLILSQTLRGETFALWVAQTPTLVDVSLSQIRVLPESYRVGDTLSAATHVMLIPQRKETKTVFILDVEQLVLI